MEVRVQIRVAGFCAGQFYPANIHAQVNYRYLGNEINPVEIIPVEMLFKCKSEIEQEPIVYVTAIVNLLPDETYFISGRILYIIR